MNKASSYVEEMGGVPLVAVPAEHIHLNFSTHCIVMLGLMSINGQLGGTPCRAST